MMTIYTKTAISLDFRCQIRLNGYEKHFINENTYMREVSIDDLLTKPLQLSQHFSYIHIVPTITRLKKYH